MADMPQDAIDEARRLHPELDGLPDEAVAGLLVTHAANFRLRTAELADRLLQTHRDIAEHYGPSTVAETLDKLREQARSLRRR